MSSPLSPHSSSTIIGTLRAAGSVYAEDEARLMMSAARTPDELTTMVDDRVRGLPLEHILGWAEFCGLRITVNPGVFVPRRRTEFLVHQAAGLAQSESVVVDLCCGSGAVGVALARSVNQVELHAADIDPNAVQCARRNIGDSGAAYEGDLYEPLPDSLRGRIDILVVNAPYVPTESIRLMPAEARLHEPRVALDGGVDGVDVHIRVAAKASQWLAHAGYLLVETSEFQAPLTLAAFERAGMLPRVVRSEKFDATVVIGHRGQGK